MCYNEGMDLLCSNYGAAAINREMVRLKRNIIGYIEIEEMVRNWPRKKPLPEQLLGRLPSIGNHESRELYEYGMHVIDNFNGE